MSWIQSPLFLGLAVLGLAAFLGLSAAGLWARRHRDSREAGSGGSGTPLLLREVPWYGFLVVYLATIGLLLFALVRFVGA